MLKTFSPTNFARLTAAVLAVTFAAALVAAPAHAGTYTQILCANPDTGQGVLPNGQWPAGISTGSHFGFGWLANCSGNVAGDGYGHGFQMSTGSVYNTNDRGWGGYLAYRAPAGISFSGGVIYRQVVASGHWSTFFNRDTNAMVMYGAPFDEQCDWGYGCQALGTPSSPFSGSNALGIGGAAGANGFNLNLLCNIPDGSWACNADASQIIRVYGGKLSLTENNSPTGTASGTLTSASVLQGNVGLSVNANDVGAGVYRVRVQRDGTTIDTQTPNPSGGQCADVNPGNADPYEFRYPQPCPTAASASYSYDTSSWSDGSHTVTVLLDDAAGNTTTLTNRTVTVDNTPPVFTIPNSSSDYSRTRSFPLADPGTGIASSSAEFSIDGGATWSSMTGAHYDSSAQAIVGTIPNSVPDGPVRVRAQGTDGAGNTAQVGYATPMTVTVDSTAPSNPAVALGSDRASNVNDFTLNWTNTGGQVAPLAVVHYKLCQVANPASCTSDQQNLATPSQSSIHVSVAAEGAYTATIWLEDEAGIVDGAHPSNTVTLTYDVTAPTGSLSRDANDWSRTVTFAGISDALSGVDAASIVAQASGDGGATWTALNAGSYDSAAGTFTGQVPAAIADGPVQVRLTFADKAGNPLATGGLNIQVDATPPTATLRAHTDWKRAFAFDAFDATSGIAALSANVEFSADNGATWQAAGGVSYDSISGRVNAEIPASAGDGTFRVRLAIADQAGNIGRSGYASSQTIDVDTTAPAGGAALDLHDDQVRASDGFTLSWTTPPGQVAPISAVHYRVCPSDGGACTTGQRALSAGQESIGGINVGADGRYAATVYLEDAAGNADDTTPSRPVTLTRDTVAPTAQLQRAGGDYSANVRFASLNDATTGVDASNVRAEASVNGTTWTTLDNARYDAATAAVTGSVPVALGNGTIRVRLTVADRAGNTLVLGDDAAPQTVTVDRSTPPGGSDLAVTAASASGSHYTVSWPNPPGTASPMTGATVKVCRADGGGCTTTTYPLASGDHSVDVDVAAQGRYTVTVALANAAGTTGRASQPATIVYDTTAPTLRLDRPVGGYTRTVRLVASDAVAGINGADVQAEASADGHTWLPLEQPAYDAGAGAYSGRTPASLGEGTLRVRAIATDRAGNTSRLGYVDPATVTVDTTAPAAVRDLRADPASSRSNDFTLRFTAPTDRGGAPITLAHIKLCVAATCRTVDQALSAGQSALPHVSAPSGDGVYTASVWLEDSAGNVNATAAAQTRLQLDTTAPRVSAQAADGALQASVGDDGTGVAKCAISIRSADTAAWTDLAATLRDGLCTAALPGDLRAAVYAVRASATDAVGNGASTERLADGTPWRLDTSSSAGAHDTTATPSSGPAAVATSLSTPLGAASCPTTSDSKLRPKAAAKRAHARTAAVCLPAAASSPGASSIVVQASAAPTVGAYLRTAAGRPMEGESVDVTITPANGKQWTAHATADVTGRVSVALPKTSPNATVSFRYAGTSRYAAAALTVAVHRPARLTLRAAGHGRLALSGRVSGPTGAAPSGQPVQIQVKSGRNWRTVKTVKTTRGGRYLAKVRVRPGVSVRATVTPRGRFAFDPSTSSTVRAPRR